MYAPTCVYDACARMSTCVHMCVRACIGDCVLTRVHASVLRAYVHACVCVLQLDRVAVAGPPRSARKGNPRCQLCLTRLVIREAERERASRPSPQAHGRRLAADRVPRRVCSVARTASGVKRHPQTGDDACSS